MSAVLPTEEQKSLLKINNHVALLKNSHITYLMDGAPFEYINTILYRIEVQLQDKKFSGLTNGQS